MLWVCLLQMQIGGQSVDCGLCLLFMHLGEGTCRHVGSKGRALDMQLVLQVTVCTTLTDSYLQSRCLYYQDINLPYLCRK